MLNRGHPHKVFSLLGVHLPVYDFGVAPTEAVTGLAEKAIFHLHGQSYGLKLLNSEQETFEYKEHLRPLIADSLRNHVTIVSEYSGSADGTFQVMLDEYNSKNRLFWLGYGKEPSRDIAPLFEKDYAVYIGGCDFDHSMIEIAQGLKWWPLPTIDNPPTHVLQQLDPLPDFPVGKENETAVLYETKLHLQRLATKWPEERSDAEIEAGALMAGLAVTDLSRYSDAAKDKRAWRLIQEGNELSDQAETLSDAAQAQGFKNASEKYAEAIRIKPDKHEAFNNWGTALIHEANTVSVDARPQILGTALEKLKRAKKLDGCGIYNLACIHAQLGNDELALDELEACQSDGTLPDKDHLDQDTDLESLRDNTCFAALFDPKKIKPVR